MKISGNTVLITGGTSGIGLELAAQLQALGNAVIVTGRNPAKLDRVLKDHPGMEGVISDASDPGAVGSLYEQVERQFPTLNILVNNAGIMRKINLQNGGSDLNEIAQEIETNLTGPVRMVKQFLPLLKKQGEAAIVNVSSGLAFVPFPISPVYSAAKAGLHAFTVALRVQLKNTRIKVIELAPPSTNTSLNDAFTAEDLKGVRMMESKAVAKKFIRGLARNHDEILPGLSKVIRAGGRFAPNLMLRVSSGSVDAMLAETKV